MYDHKLFSNSVLIIQILILCYQYRLFRYVTAVAKCNRACERSGHRSRDQQAAHSRSTNNRQ